MSMGTVTVRAQHELSAITATGNTTPHTVEFQNAETGIVTTANVEVGKDLTVSGNVAVDTDTLFVDTVNSRVGVGTDNPLVKLDVRGAIITPVVSYTGNQDAAYLIAGTSGYTGAATNWNTHGFQHRIKSNSGGVPRITVDAPTGGEVFSIVNGGNVGIGTTDPAYSFDVQTTSDASDKTMTRLYSAANATGVSSTGLILEKGAGYGGVIKGFISQGIGSGLSLHTLNGGTEARAMTIMNSGNVGVGTTTPLSELDIYNPAGTELIVSRNAGSSVNPSIRLWNFDDNNYNNHAVGTSVGTINFSGNERLTGDTHTDDSRAFSYANTLYDWARISALFVGSSASATTSQGNVRGDLAFYTNGGDVATSDLQERMRIKHNGNVGIGKTNPSQKLDVNGVIKSTVPSWHMYNTNTIHTGTLNFTENMVTPQNCSVSLSAGRVTITTAGRYCVSFHAFTESTVTRGTGCQIAIMKSGTTYVRNYHVQPVTAVTAGPTASSSHSATGGLTAIMDLAVNDYVEVNTNFLVHYNLGATFSGFMIG